MKKKRMRQIATILIIVLVSGIPYSTSAQYKRKLNGYLTGGYTMTIHGSGNLDDYYSDGYGSEFHLVYSLAKRKTNGRLCLVANTGYHHFGKKAWYEYDHSGNLIKYQSTPIGVIPIHGGLRFDIGINHSNHTGLYVSQAWGITYIDGPNGGERRGHAFNIGIVAKRAAFDFGANTWIGTTGKKFHFFTIRAGYMLF